MKRYGEKTLREALENGAVLSIYDCPARGPILRVKKDDENLGWITFDLYLKIRLDLEVVKKGEWIKEYTLKSIVYADFRIGALTETTETETTETTETETVSNRKKYVATFMDGLDASIRVEFLEATDEKHAQYKARHMAGMFETVENVREVDPGDFEEISGVTVPCFVDAMSYDEISGTIDALKKAVAPLEAGMGADNISKEEWLELDKEVIRTWEEIGVLQYLQIVQGTGVDPSNRKFRDVEMGEIVTIDDVLHTWATYKEIHEEHPHFPKYLGNCQTFKGGTLEEIR